MILFPPAKVNLGLHVLGKRNDGYHAIETTMIPVPLCDVLEILPSDVFSFEQTGLVVDGHQEDNLCVRAFRLMEQRYGISPVYMHLRKCIPMGAGLGGGSSDAAYVLKGLNDCYQLGIDTNALQSLAATLGSDCPFFIQSVPSLATGRGEQIEAIEVDVSQWWIKIINPGIHISTAKAYGGVHISIDHRSSIARLVLGSPDEWKERLHNDFEQHLFLEYPLLASIKESLYAEGAFYAAMSGSGSTIFGLYRSEPKPCFTAYMEYISRLKES